MAVSLCKKIFQTAKKRIIQQRRVSLYNVAHGYEEELIKKKLQQFAGGSINLSKEDNGIGILTVNNPQLMNAFTGINQLTEMRIWFLCLFLIPPTPLQLVLLGFCINKVKSCALPFLN